MKNLKVTAFFALFFIVLVFSSCFGDTKNEFRVTHQTFATVTDNGNGEYRLFLDEFRGILEPDEGTGINWGDARRVTILYDLPYLDSVGENTRFKSRIREAYKLPVLSFIDLTGVEELPDSLGNDPITGFALNAYRGYMNLSAYVDKNSIKSGYSLNYSYDRNEFKGDTLFLNLHYSEKENVNYAGYDENLFASFEFPQFIRNAGLTVDSLCIALTATVWTDRNNKKESHKVTRHTKISRGRLNPPTYDRY